MIEKEQHEAGRDDAFYGAQYARFGSRLAAEIRRETYGEDLGQQGWRTLDEQAEIAYLVGRHSPSRLLDVACGSGGPSLAIAFATGCRLTGVDVEPSGVAEARQRAVELELAGTTEFLVANCNDRLPFDRNAFDVVVCIDAILHLRDRFAALADWCRVAAPGGQLFLADAAVLTGPVSKEEIDIRASQGDFVFVPPGLNEAAIGQAGFRLRNCRDTTPAVAEIAGRLHAAREVRSAALQEQEGRDWFSKRQTFLSITRDLAASGRLSRFVYVAEKPA